MSDTTREVDVVVRLMTDADEIEACGAGNEAANMRESAATIRALQDALNLAVSRGCDHCADSIREARKVAGAYLPELKGAALKHYIDRNFPTDTDVAD